MRFLRDYNYTKYLKKPQNVVILFYIYIKMIIFVANCN